LPNAAECADSGVEFVYVSVKDHHASYKTIEHTIQDMVSAPGIQKEQKSEILYATNIELANQLFVAPRQKGNRLLVVGFYV